MAQFVTVVEQATDIRRTAELWLCSAGPGTSLAILHSLRMPHPTCGGEVGVNKMSRFSRGFALLALGLGSMHISAKEAQACGPVGCNSFFRMGFSGSFAQPMPIAVPQPVPFPVPVPIQQPIPMPQPIGIPQQFPMGTHGGFNAGGGFAFNGGFAASRPVGVSRVRFRGRIRQMGCAGNRCGSARVKFRASFRMRGRGCFGRSFRRC
jgi:hypothetical protein